MFPFWDLMTIISFVLLLLICGMWNISGKDCMVAVFHSYVGAVDCSFSAIDVKYKLNFSATVLASEIGLSFSSK